MPYIHVQCKQCGAVAFTDDLADPDAALSCPCCPADHDHAAQANACPGIDAGHEGADCPHPEPLACTAVTAVGEPCPGGHCGVGVDECTVCRPVTIMFPPGTIPVA